MHKSTRKLIAVGSFIAVFQTMVWAANTNIDNTPMAVANLVKPNVMFTLDNSGGVDVDVLLPTFNTLYYEKIVSGSSTGISNYSGFFYLFPNAGISRPEPQYRMGFPGGLNPDPLAWKAYYYGYNTVYYNPYVTYRPWVGLDNASVAFGNATPTAVRLDPYLAAGPTYDITTTSAAYLATTYLNAAGTACNNATCTQSRTYSTTIFPASYYIMTAGVGVLYQIKPSTPSYPSGRVYAAELQNFANWFQYYRTPFLALKGAIGQSLTFMGQTRIGVTDLDHTTPNAAVADMNVTANLSNLQTSVYNIATTPSDWTQPMHERLQNVWNYYNRAAGSTSPPAPIQASCQQNFNIVVSPGYLNDPGYSGGGGTWTNTHSGVNVTPTAISPLNFDNSANPPFGVGVAPYADVYSDTLADWSAYYYVKPLRTDLATGQVPVVSNTHDVNPNLHVTTYVLAPGAIPLISTQNPSPSPLSDAQNVNLFSTTTPPYTAPTVTWPLPCFVCQDTIDDLWHAAINGGGIFVNSTNIAGGLTTILNDILDRTGSGAAVAVSNPNVSTTDHTSFASTYNSGTWTGNLFAYQIDTNTGVVQTSSPTWATSAQAQLDAKVWTTRKIATYSGSAGIPFQAASLSAGLLARLNSPTTPPGPTDNGTVINFLRGDTSQQGTLYRSRLHILGDIINSEPAYVAAPTAKYADSGYTSFLSTASTRPKMVYQGANDGMLHAFNAADGAERWAYVPGLLINAPYVVTSPAITYPGTSSLVNLSMKTGFTHLSYVDGTPAEGDVDLNNTYGGHGASNWISLLVGGLNNGGSGYYALNVTDPTTVSSDATAANNVMWEFPNSSTAVSVTKNIGKSFGNPVIVKTAAAGWVVLVTSGYNNGSDTGGDGLGHLFVLNAATGALISDIATSVGSSGTPSGLGKISAYVVNASVDNTADYVYGGDLQGNLWRFDLTGTTIGSWNVKRLANLVDAFGNAQPITAAPELGNVNNLRYVYVGTGQYFSIADVPGQIGANSHATQTQTFYGLVDNLSATPEITPLRSNLVHNVLTTSGSTATVTVGTSPGTNDGWYVDLPNAGERSVTDPVLAVGMIALTTDIPSANSCAPGGSSWLYFLDMASGGHSINSVGSTSGNFLGNVLASRPNLVKLPNGQIISIIRTSNAQNISQPLTNPASGLTGRRVLWREIITN